MSPKILHNENICCLEKTFNDMAASNVQTMQPSLGFDDLSVYLTHINPEAMCEMRVTLHPSQQVDKKAIMEWLYMEFPASYAALQQIERIWQTGFDIVHEQVDGICQIFKGLQKEEKKKTQLEITYDVDNGTMSKKKQKPRPVRKRALENFEDEEESRKRYEATWYSSKDPWSDIFKPGDFHLYRSKNKDCSFLSNYNIYKTIYHCSSTWGMEQLAEKLQKEKHHAVMVKAARIPADMDMLRWKVISSEDFEPTKVIEEVL